MTLEILLKEILAAAVLAGLLGSLLRDDTSEGPEPEVIPVPVKNSENH